MSNIKKVVTISPENVKENLSTSEWQALVNTIDKLLSLDIETRLTYEEITNSAIVSRSQS